MATSNGELIDQAVAMVHACGRRPATVDEARDLLDVRPPRAQLNAS